MDPAMCRVHLPFIIRCRKTSLCHNKGVSFGIKENQKPKRQYKVTIDKIISNKYKKLCKNVIFYVPLHWLCDIINLTHFNEI